MVRRAKAKALDRKRRTPIHSRALDTVEVVFEATARILLAEGMAGLNTNRIAETAGVSIGAIYGYFPNKQAILLAMARRELDGLRARVERALAGGAEQEPDPVRRAVRALIRGYGARGKVRRILMETLFAQGGTEEMARPVSEIAEMLARHGETLLPRGARPLSPVALYVLTRTVDGLIRTATYENVPFLAGAEFEDETVRLIHRYLAA